MTHDHEYQSEHTDAASQTRSVKIRMYGEEHEFDVRPEETILTAAQRADTPASEANAATS